MIGLIFQKVAEAKHYTSFVIDYTFAVSKIIF